MAKLVKKFSLDKLLTVVLSVLMAVTVITPMQVSAATVEGNTITLKQGESYELVETNYTWVIAKFNSANKKIAKLDNDRRQEAGAYNPSVVITAGELGETKVTFKVKAFAGDWHDEKVYNIIVVPNLADKLSVSVNNGTNVMVAGTTAKVDVVGEPANAELGKLSYEITSGNELATIDQEGNLTANPDMSGKVTVKVSNDNGKTAECVVEVKVLQKYTVTLNPNNGKENTTVTAVEGNKGLGSALSTPTNGNKHFAGWYDKSGKLYDGNTPITGDVTLTAKWTDGYKVTFNANGGDKNSVPAEMFIGGLVGSKMPNKIPSRSGYVFAGWTDKSSDGNTFDAKYNVTKNVTIYAQWVKDNGDYKDKNHIITGQTPDRAGKDDNHELDGLKPGEVGAEKKAQWVDYDNGIARIDFDLQGIPVKTGSDVIIVLDKSTSMNPDKENGYTDRWARATEAVTKMGTTLLDGKSNNRVAVVEFSGNVKSSFNFVNTLDKFTKNFNTNTPKHEGKLNPSGDGTDYGIALKQAIYYASTRTDEELKRPLYVVFISDGEPSSKSANGLEHAKVLKDSGATIVSIGIQLAKGKEAALKNLSSDGTYTNVQNVDKDLDTVLQQVAASIRKAATNTVLIDTLSQYFDFAPVTSEYPLPEGATIKGNKIEIKVGDISADKQTISIYIKLKDEYKKDKRIYETNKEVDLNYDDVNGNSGHKDETDMPSPELSVNCGSIAISYYLVNENGDYIKENGTKIPAGSELLRVLVHTTKYKVNNDPKLEIASKGTTYNVEPQDVPTRYVVYNPAPQSVTLLPNSPDAKVEFKVMVQTTADYTVIHNLEDVNNLGNYVVKETEIKTGKLDAQTEAVAKAYEGYTAQPFEQVTITPDNKAVVNIYYNLARYEVKLNYVSDDKPSVELKTQVVKSNIAHGANYDYSGLADKIITQGDKQYVLISVAGAIKGTAKSNVDVVLTYSLDANKNEIPDIYEATVKYFVTNGTFAGGLTEVVQNYPTHKYNPATFTWDVLPTPVLKDVPTPTPNEGYAPESLNWTPVEPVNGAEVKDGAEYIASYGIITSTGSIDYVVEKEFT